MNPKPFGVNRTQFSRSPVRLQSSTDSITNLECSTLRYATSFTARFSASSFSLRTLSASNAASSSAVSSITIGSGDGSFDSSSSELVSKSPEDAAE